MASQKEGKKKGILRRIWERIVKAEQTGTTQAGKIDLKKQEWPK